MEQQFLGGLIRHPTMIAAAICVVREADFRAERDRLVFAALATLHASGSPVDLVALAEHLHAHGHVQQAGGYSRLGELWEAGCREDQILELAQQLRESNSGQ
jgi:replicative DNA helicase